MKHYKLKVCISAVLAALFLAAAVMLIYYPQKNTYLTDSDIDAVVSLLKTKNIKIDKDIIPTVAKSMPKATASTAFSTAEEMAKAIFVDDFSSSKGVCEKDGVKLRLVPEISIVCDKPQFATLFETVKPDNADKKIIKALGKYKIDVKDAIIEIYDNEKNKNLSVVVTQTHEGFAVFNNSLLFEVSDKGIKKVSGLYLISEKGNGAHKPKSPVDALVKFATEPKNRGSEIISIKQGYRADTREQNVYNVKLVPVWSILTDEGEVYFVDA